MIRKAKKYILLIFLIILLLPSQESTSAKNSEGDHSYLGLHFVAGGVDGLDLWAMGFYGELDTIGIRFIFERDTSIIHVMNDRSNGFFYDYRIRSLNTIATDFFWIFPKKALFAFIGGGLGYTYHQNPTLLGGYFYSLRGTYGLGLMTKNGMRVTMEATHSAPAKLLTQYQGLYHGLRLSFSYGR